MNHFLKETDFKPHQLAEILSLSESLKKNRGRHTPPTLEGQSWGMLFSKSSTRTRVSFEVGIRELGGFPIFLSKDDIQLGRGESIRDTARVLSRYLHGLIVRTFDHSDVEELARYGSVPVVNALTDFLHPCQTYTDLFSLAERWQNGGGLLDALKGKKIAFLGDTACNVASSWILGANLAEMQISLAGPTEYAPAPEVASLLKESGFSEDAYHFTSNAEEAVEGADVVYTDVWVSMGKEDEAQERIENMMPYQVNAELMKKASPHALFLHCLPAYIGKEVTEEVLEGPASIVFDQAENRLHVQKAILSVLGRGPR